jgi:hypothetical protein
MQINNIEKKISKGIGILFRARPYLTKNCLIQLYYTFINSHLNYANMAWANANFTKLRKLHTLQKHAIRIILNKDRFTHSRLLLKSLRILNIYQLNIYQNLSFVRLTKAKMCSKVFDNIFKNVEHKYATRYPASGLRQPRINLQSSRFKISSRGPFLWNNILNKKEKEIKSHSIFQRTIKEKLLKEINESDFF